MMDTGCCAAMQSFASLPESRDRSARKNRYEHPPEFPWLGPYPVQFLTYKLWCSLALSTFVYPPLFPFCYDPSLFLYFQNSPSWDICDDANHKTNGFWAIMRALVYYTCNPTPVEIIAYFLYWIIALSFLSFKLHLA